MLHSIYDLTTFCRKTTGDVPPKLVGASTTVVGKYLYLYGGRLVAERRIVSDMYLFDMETFRWEKIPNHTDDILPRSRYFHSTDTWDNYLVVFGGMTNQLDSPNPDDLCVLNDVHFFDLATRRWVPGSLPQSSEANVPRARYAHLSAITSDRLFVIGGQDFYNTWLDDICVFDLRTKTWVQRRDYPRHCGTYRSVAVASQMTVRIPTDDIRASHASATLGNPGTRFRIEQADSDEFTPSESLIHLPYSAPPSDDHPSDIYLYSNYNFTDVKRELEVISPLPEADFTIQDRSSTMTGSTFPPGLRFPNGAILGTHLIIAGTYLAHSYQSFSIWVLDLVSMTWSRVDPGKALETGSWFRACLWADANKFLIFGNRNGNLVDDYNRRLLSWDHVAVVDLEAFGIYQPPSLRLDLRMQEFGLAALEEHVLADFELVCDDGRRIPCSRKLLDDRWPWFKEQRVKMLQLALTTSESLPASSMHTSLQPVPGMASSAGDENPQLDPRLTARTFHLSEPYPIALAFLQYFYSQALITPLQHAPAVLSQLLVLSTVYKLPHLEHLVRHAMHRMLSNSTSVAVYEVATLCSCRSLQIRALKTVMSYTQKKPTKIKGDGGPGNGGGPDGGRPGCGGGGGSGTDTEPSISRPRGTSDAKWRTLGETGSTRPDGGRPSIAGENERLTPLYHIRSKSDIVRREPQPRHHMNTKSMDSEHSASSDSFKAHALPSRASFKAAPSVVKSLSERSTHSRSGSSSTDHSASDYGEPLQSGASASVFSTPARAQSERLAPVAEQEKRRASQRTPRPSEQENEWKRPRAQSATARLLRQFPAPPVPLRSMASLTQLSRSHVQSFQLAQDGSFGDQFADNDPNRWHSNTPLSDVWEGEMQHTVSQSIYHSQNSPSPRNSMLPMTVRASMSSQPSTPRTSSDSFPLPLTPLQTVDESYRYMMPSIYGASSPPMLGQRKTNYVHPPLSVNLPTPPTTSSSVSTSTSTPGLVTPALSQSSFHRLLAKVAIGKDNGKEANITSSPPSPTKAAAGESRRKKRDNVSMYDTAAFTLM